MTDTIHTNTTSENNGTGIFLGGIALILFAMFFVFYGLPAIRGGQAPSPAAPAQQAPAANGIGIPDEIDVNVNQAEK